MIRSLTVALLFGALAASGQWQIDTLHPPSKALLIGMDLSADSTLWISGTRSTIIRSRDFGEHFEHIPFMASDTMQFRDVHGINRSSCLLMSAGLGSASQIWLFHEETGFRKVFQMRHPKGFLDAIEFWDAKNGLAYGDAVDEHPYILITGDGGETWRRCPSTGLPEALSGEGGFAASGTCVETAAGGRAWIGTGAGKQARILFTKDFGKTWQVKRSPLPAGDFSGITSLRYYSGALYVTGGNLGDTTLQQNLFRLDLSEDKWYEIKACPMKGAYYCLDVLGPNELIVCGPAGAAFKKEDPGGWSMVSGFNLWACHFWVNKIFLVGKNGNCIRFKR